MKKHYCPEHGVELEISWEHNRYTVMVAGEYPLTLGEDFDTKTGERLYCIVGKCPHKKQRFLPFLEPKETHYHKLIQKDATKPNASVSEANTQPLPPIE